MPTATYALDNLLVNRKMVSSSLDVVKRAVQVHSYAMDAAASVTLNVAASVNVYVGQISIQPPPIVPTPPEALIVDQLIGPDVLAPAIEVPVPWWNRKFSFRRLIYVAAPGHGLSAGHPIRSLIDLDFLKRQSKIRPDAADYRVIYNRRAIPSLVLEEDKKTYISFALQTTLPSGTQDVYAIYYGSKDRVRPATYEEPRWPIFLSHTHPAVSFSYPDRAWDLSDKPVTEGGLATISLYGDSAKVLLEMGPDAGIAKVAGNVYDLYSETPNFQTVIFQNLDVTQLTRINVQGLLIKNPASFGRRVMVRGVYVRSIPHIVDQGEELVFGAFQTIAGT